MSERSALLVLGLGNVLLGDDGVGVMALGQVAHDYSVPNGVSLHDGGTLGLSLLPLLTAAERVILVDAVSADAPAGSLVRLEGDAVGHALLHRLSPHQVGVADLFDAARLLDAFPETLVLVGVVPERIELEVGLSPSVARSLSALTQQVVEEAARLGYVFVAKPGFVSEESHVPQSSPRSEVPLERSYFDVARLAAL